MRIRDLGVIEDALLEFGSGLTAVTGETGAGKTMIVSGLGLLLGARSDPGRVRAGARRTAVDGRFRVDRDGAIAARAEQAGAELDDGALLASRTVSREGRSRAYAGGAPVPVSVLGELAAGLVAVHGQSDQQRLLRPAEQRSALDRYAGPAVLDVLARYAADFARLREIDATLAELLSRARDRAQEADLLRFGLAEVAAAAPVPGEDVELAAEIERLTHADALRGAAAAAHALLTGDVAAADDTDAAGLVANARRALDAAAAHDRRLTELADRVAEVGHLVTDVASDLASYAASIEVDPVRLAAAHERRAVLAALTRKYAGDIAGVLAWARSAAGRLADLGADDDRVAVLSAERGAARERLGAVAGQLSTQRRAAGTRFAAAVQAELRHLALPHARVAVEVAQAEAADGLSVEARRLAFDAAGVDDVEIRLASHTGAPYRPLARGASGGELSRIMLAVEVVLAGVAPVPTLVFDEVDAGVGGRAAAEVGRRLARLARSAQVIVVTHLPQVAAYADRHVSVAKSHDGRVTASGVRTLDDGGRVRELSRMLAGQEESRLARGHAEELLAAAAAAKTARVAG